MQVVWLKKDLIPTTIWFIVRRKNVRLKICLFNSWFLIEIRWLQKVYYDEITLIAENFNPNRKKVYYMRQESWLQKGVLR